ncbi:hypothetical protein SEA_GANTCHERGOBLIN_37 [Arthrobacter phage GantcherGoblin]|nr:hypothetical protein SEA_GANTCHERGOBLIN_37 [Arthrobacter phage GantcherGoblin]
MEKHGWTPEERELNNQLLKSLAIFLGMKLALYVFIAWAAKAARKASQ